MMEITIEGIHNRIEVVTLYKDNYVGRKMVTKSNTYDIDFYLLLHDGTIIEDTIEVASDEPITFTGAESIVRDKFVKTFKSVGR